MRQKTAISLIPMLAAAVIASSTETSAMDIAPVTVTASYLEDFQELSPGTISVIRPDETKGEFKTLPDLLRQSVGVHITEIQGHGGYTVASIRGSTSSQVAVYVDNVLMNSASEPTVDLSTVPIENVERIEIYRGHIPARFGVSGMGAVINIVTKAPSKSENSVMIGAGSLGLEKWSSRTVFPTGSGTSLFTTELEGYDGDFSFHNTRGTANGKDDYEAKRQFNSYTFEDLMYKWADDDWTFKTHYYHKNRDVPYSARLNNDVIENGTLYGRRRQDISKKEISIARDLQMGSFDGDVYLLYMDESKEFKDPTGTRRGNMPSWSDFDSSRIEGGIQLNRWIGESQQLSFYGNWAFEDHDVAGDGGYSIYNIEHYSRHSLKLTLEDTIFPFEGTDIQIVPMIRYNKVGEDDGWSWSLAGSYPLSGGWNIKSSIGHYFRSPSFYEIFGDGVYIVPNDSIKAEEGDQWDLGLRWNGNIGSVKTEAGITYFHSKTEDLIVFVDKGPFQGKYENIDDAEVDGIEAEINAKWDKRSLSIGYTYMDSTNLAVNEQYRDNPLPNRPEHAWHLRFQQGFGESLTGFAEVSYISDNYLDQLGEVVWSDYSKVDLGGKWRIEEDLLLSMGVNDVFDTTKNIHSYGVSLPGTTLTPQYPLEGRTFYLSIIWDI